MKDKKTRSTLLLLLTAVIWGAAFVAQSVGGESVGSLTFNGMRSLIGSVVLLPVIFMSDRKQKKNLCDSGSKSTRKNSKELWIGGILCGLIFCIASNVQQIGITETTVGKAGFITALYIVIVPILGIFVGKKVGKQIWAGVLLAVAGLYFLCMNGESFVISKGDVLIFFCSILFSFHILAIDHFSPKVDGVCLSCIQFFVSGVISMILAFWLENPQWRSIVQAGIPLLYTGVLSSGVGYTLQILGQRDADPTVASLVLSLESVFSVLAGWMILNQGLSETELLGCVLMFAAIILAQLPEKLFGKKKKCCFSQESGLS